MKNDSIEPHKRITLFHGSRTKMTEVIPHKSRIFSYDEKGGQLGVFATPDRTLAMIYAMSVKRSKLFNSKYKKIYCSDGIINVVLENCYLAQSEGFVYEVFPDGFIRNSDFEYYSTNRAICKNCIKISFSQIEELINQGRIILSQDNPPTNALYKILLHRVDDLTHFASFFRLFYYKLRSIKRVTITNKCFF